jgi:predicted RecA/RadA family phage recombinase
MADMMAEVFGHRSLTGVRTPCLDSHMTNSEQTIKAGDMVRYGDLPGVWLVTAVAGNRLTVSNPHTHGGRTYIPADKCEVVPWDG